MFKKASQQKLRFITSKGLISVEDLWDLPLTSARGVSLDGIAMAVNKALQSSKEDSFVTVKSDGNAIFELQLDILKAVIADKIALNEANRTAVARAQQRNKITEILANKQDDALANKTVEELEVMLAATS